MNGAGKSYAGLVILFGAEFTQEYANKFGHHVVPTDAAVSTVQKDDRNN